MCQISVIHEMSLLVFKVLNYLSSVAVWVYPKGNNASGTVSGKVKLNARHVFIAVAQLLLSQPMDF